MKDTYCAAPFVGVQVDTQGQLTPCCEYQSTVSYNYQQFDQWQQECLIPLQQDLLAGKPASGCVRCWRHEQTNPHSYRQVINQLYPEKVDSTQSPRHVTIQFGNYCNLRCLQCNGALSSSHATEQHQHQDQFKKLNFFQPIFSVSNYYQQPDFISLLQSWIPSIDTVFLHGGEPLITPGCIEFLQAIPRPDRTQVSVTTNATKLSAAMLNVLSRFESVEITVSLDGVGAHAEYVRHGCDWSQVCANIDRLKALPNLRNGRITVHSVFQHVSFYTLNDIIDFCAASGIPLSLGMLDQPPWLSIHSLTHEQAQQFVQNLRHKRVELNQQWSVCSAIDLALDWMVGHNYNADLRKQFDQHIGVLDQIRKNSFQKIFLDAVV